MNTQQPNNKKLFLGTAAFISLVVIGVVIYALDCNGYTEFMRIVALGSLIAGAFALIGGLLGFLFGIPRTLSGNDDSKPVAGISYRINTNLEQISDWLTKILVGVGLTEMKNIPDFLLQISTHLAKTFPGDIDRTGFLVSVIIYSIGSGFLSGYVWTRVVLAPLFQAADKKLFAREQEVRLAEQEIKSMEQKHAEISAAINNMLVNLYEYGAKGFLKAIDTAKSIVKKFGEPDDVMFWIRLACAHSQEYCYAMQHDKDEVVMKQAMGETFKAIDKALQIDKTSTKFWLHYLGNPDYKGKPPDENDFEVFWNMDEFRRRLTI